MRIYLSFFSKFQIQPSNIQDESLEFIISFSSWPRTWRGCKYLTTFLVGLNFRNGCLPGWQWWSAFWSNTSVRHAFHKRQRKNATAWRYVFWQKVLKPHNTYIKRKNLYNLHLTKTFSLITSNVWRMCWVFCFRCGLSGYPGVYVNVTSVVEWVVQTAARGSSRYNPIVICQGSFGPNLVQKMFLKQKIPEQWPDK